MKITFLLKAIENAASDKLERLQRATIHQKRLDEDFKQADYSWPQLVDINSNVVSVDITDQENRESNFRQALDTSYEINDKKLQNAIFFLITPNYGVLPLLLASVIREYSQSKCSNSTIISSLELPSQHRKLYITKDSEHEDTYQLSYKATLTFSEARNVSVHHIKALTASNVQNPNDQDLYGQSPSLGEIEVTVSIEKDPSMPCGFKFHLENEVNINFDINENNQQIFSAFWTLCGPDFEKGAQKKELEITNQGDAQHFAKTMTTEHATALLALPINDNNIKFFLTWLENLEALGIPLEPEELLTSLESIDIKEIDEEKALDMLTKKMQWLMDKQPSAEFIVNFIFENKKDTLEQKDIAEQLDTTIIQLLQQSENYIDQKINQFLKEKIRQNTNKSDDEKKRDKAIEIAINTHRMEYKKKCLKAILISSSLPGDNVETKQEELTNRLDGINDSFCKKVFKDRVVSENVRWFFSRVATSIVSLFVKRVDRPSYKNYGMHFLLGRTRTAKQFNEECTQPLKKNIVRGLATP